MALPSSRRFDWQLATFADSRTAPTTGIRIAARIPMIAMTVKSSINVNPREVVGLGFFMVHYGTNCESRIPVNSGTAYFRWRYHKNRSFALFLLLIDSILPEMKN